MGNSATKLDPAKFQDPDVTAKGEARASVPPTRLETLWFNTGTLCNIACHHCYIESSPTNDRLVYLTAEEVSRFLDEIEEEELGTREIGFTGGEPFVNPEFVAMLGDALGRGFDVLVLTNGMRPLLNKRDELLDVLDEEQRHRLTFRVSIDHYTRERHEEERGLRTWKPMMEGFTWLAEAGFCVSAAGRMRWDEDESSMRRGYEELFSDRGIPIDAHDPTRLILFPEMDETVDVPEITTACWDILGTSPADVMCATSRMVVRRKGAEQAVVLACTLIAYDEAFEMGATLTEALRPVKLNHPHCAKFCVLGGASCSA